MGRIKVKKIKLYNKKISNKIVLISDIHYHNKKDLNKLNKVLEKINSLKPNYICILGDTCDQAKILDEDILIDWLQRLSKISKVIMVYGNHDIALYDTNNFYLNEKLFNKVKKIKNLELLDNNIKEENGICFVGTKLDYDYYYKLKENSKEFIRHYNSFIKKLSSNNYNILLTHSPIALTQEGTIKELNDYKNIDLILCGHMHGGMVPEILRPIFKTRGILGPNKKKLFIKNAYGNFKIENISFMVSSGITKLSNVSRINFLDVLFRPEIVLIDIIKDEN